MFNFTFATLLFSPEEVDDRNEPPLLAMLWTICLELITVFLSIWVLCERSLRIKIQQEMVEREGKLAEHEGKLTKLVSEFKQVFIYAQGIIADFNDFAVPFQETIMGFFDIRDLIAGASAIAAAPAGIDISPSASCPHNKFMRKAEECLILAALTRKSLCNLLEYGYDDAVDQAGPIDARYAHGLAEFKRRMAELEAQGELEPDSGSDLEYDDLEAGGLPSLFPAYDNTTRLVSLCDENGVVNPNTQDKKDGELFV
ncbi:hypothetical protein CGRA01v4_08590 [Colletotrichum graminicola]|uniref:Uncharacterized protein n=1 Tax=Colletotrichum graminicola (strain M1.001 / M2 / FGSC 10212) TaxID=645133 RepID=E3QJD8_COLGM|nr:uncharacterized protein GLRG_06120 [Colletotrichum graminicola M1.001]EFQ30976.1 hypothetical protein GLRG_06120 [Colletotrichum graminicola M1.001]WDK17307.1 hypothetical protein CGRA01v4_08590 [Colletotrichum graminicola]